MKKKTTLKLLWGIFAFVGLCFWIFTIIFGIVSKNKQNKMELSYAVISDLTEDDDGGDAYVDYEFDGEVFTHRHLGYYSSSMRIGDYVDIYIDPAEPMDITAKNGRMITLIIMGGFGVVFTLIGGIGIAYLVLKQKKNKRLFQDGKRLNGVIDTISVNTHVEVNGENPYYAVVVVRDEYTGAEKFFKSDNLWDVDMSTIKEGDSAVVYVDPKDEKKYFVDVTGANAIMGSTMEELF